MSQQALIPINPGDAADADVISGNFNYLKDKITETNTNVTTIQNNVTNVITTTLSVYQDIEKPKDSFDEDATNATSGDCYIKSNTIVAFTPTGNVTFHLPTITDNTKFYQILVQINLTNTTYISANDNRLGTNYYFNNTKPIFDYIGKYDLIYAFDSLEQKWCVRAIYKGVVS